jgi:hypothetical protein
VAGERVADLLEEITVHQGSRKARGDYLARYIRSQNAMGGLVDWTVALISNQAGEPALAAELGGWTVHPVQRAPHLTDSLDAASVYRIRRLVSPTDEMIGLTEDQRARALDQTVRQHLDHQEASRHRNVPTRPSGPSIRRVRGHRNGLLLIYPVRERNADGPTFVGFAVSFPAADRDTPIRYVVNSIYWQEELDL